MITPPQFRAARALAEWSRDALSEASGIEAGIIEAIERGSRPPTREEAAALRCALERGGIQFLPERNALGVGVRLKFARQTSKRIDVFENEGGPARDDDVM